MKFKANFVEKPVNFQMDDCQIEKVVELSHEDFCRLRITPLADQPFIRENKDCMFHRDGVIHCLLALGQGSNDGVLVDAEQYDCARLAAYVPGMRDIVNAQMDRAADFIIRWGTESTTSGSWCVYFDDLEEHLDLTVREGSGLDSMLRAALKRRPEVAAVDMHDGCIETEYHPEYCQRLSNNFEPENKPLRLNNAIKLTRSYQKESCAAGRGVNARGHTQEKCGCRQPRVWDSCGLGGRAGDYAPRSGSRQRAPPEGHGSRSRPRRRN